MRIRLAASAPLAALLLPINGDAAPGGFVRWWEDWEQRCKGTTYPTARKVHVNLGRSAARSDLSGSIPPELRPAVGEVHVLWAEGDRQLLLALPPDLSGSAEPPQVCWARQSWITLSPEGIWSPLGLNPFCGDPYGPDEVDFAIFLDRDEGLFIEVVTNAPATIPYALYRFVGGRLELVSEYGMPGC